MKYEIWCGPESSSIIEIAEDVDKMRKMSQDDGEHLIQTFEAQDMEYAKEKFERFNRIFGETIRYTKEVLKVNVREIIQDGKELAMTMDFDETRYNVSTDKHGWIDNVINMG